MHSYSQPAGSLHAEKTPLISEAAINEAEKAPLSDGNCKPPLSNLINWSRVRRPGCQGIRVDQDMYQQGTAPRRGVRGRRGTCIKGRARQCGARMHEGQRVGARHTYVRNSHWHACTYVARAHLTKGGRMQWRGQPAVPPSTGRGSIRQYRLASWAA